MGHTAINYRTFDQLMNDLLVDLRIIDEEGLIEPSQLIKVAQRVNYDLGLRIHQTKEIILDINNSVAKLPEDFYILNFALVTGHYKCITPITWAGRTTENVPISCSGDTCCLTPLTYDTNRLNSNRTYCPDDSCGILDNTCGADVDPWSQRKCYSMCGTDNCVKVIEHRGHEVREYSWFEKLYIKPQAYLDPGSMNAKFVGCASAEIKNGYLYCSKPEGKLYISYQGNLEDENGNLLVLSHPEIDFYYLAALTEYIFKILWYSNNEEVKGKYDQAKQETREARVRALSIVNTPDFQEMQKMFELNRLAQWKKYYQTFHTNVFQRWNNTTAY